MLSQLSFWPWIIGGFVSFLVVLIMTNRTSPIPSGLLLFGGGAVTVIVCGLIEASVTGVFVGHSVGDVVGATLGLGLTSMFSSVLSLFPAQGAARR